jgi:VanZ family protein
MDNFSSPLRFKILWLSIGWSLVLAVIVLALIPPPSITKGAIYTDKIGHFIAYFILMGWFAQIYHVPKQRLLFMIGFLLLGGLLEILQGLSGIRQADWFDMLANSTGVLAAWQLTKNRFAYVLVYIDAWFNIR